LPRFISLCARADTAGGDSSLEEGSIVASSIKRNQSKTQLNSKKVRAGDHLRVALFLVSVELYIQIATLFRSHPLDSVCGIVHLTCEIWRRKHVEVHHHTNIQVLYVWYFRHVVLRPQ
jgi:hypothetical protein